MLALENSALKAPVAREMSTSPPFTFFSNEKEVQKNPIPHHKHTCHPAPSRGRCSSRNYVAAVSVEIILSSSTHSEEFLYLLTPRNDGDIQL